MNKLIIFLLAILVISCGNDDTLLPTNITESWSFSTESDEMTIDIPSGQSSVSLQIESTDLCIAYGIEVILEQNNTLITRDTIRGFPNEISWSLNNDESHKLITRSIVEDSMVDCLLFGNVDFTLN